MRKIFFIMAILNTTQTVFAETQKACFKVEGMTCAACTVTTKAAINKLEGIANVKVSFEEKKAEVKFDDTKTKPDEILKKIISIGYKATPLACNR